MQLIDLAGHKYGRLQVLSFSHFKQEDDRVRRSLWKCKCDCGNETVVIGKSMRNGTTLSCGCLRRETVATKNFKHGKAKRGEINAEYYAWCEIIRRTENKNCVAYENYGARGILMSKEWRESFEQFLKDMGPKPTPKYSVERINNNGNYESSNCKWDTRHNQSRNKRNNIWITYNEETLCAKDWSLKLGMNYLTVMNRIRKGWDRVDAITIPIRKCKTVKTR